MIARSKPNVDYNFCGSVFVEKDNKLIILYLIVFF